MHVECVVGVQELEEVMAQSGSESSASARVQLTRQHAVRVIRVKEGLLGLLGLLGFLGLLALWGC
jgi:hypothetical protein